MLQKKIIQHYSFSLADKIGKGFSSTVYKGKDDNTSETIAIKVIQMKMLQEDEIYKQLLKSEIQALRQLSNKTNILHLLDAYSTRNNTYLMTEFCETDLNKIIKQKKKMSLHQAITIIEQISNGYLQIHKLGYVHRDIKPANIFLKNKKYKIADFGFAVKISDLANHQNYNVGSPMYMSPEALKENKYSFSSDLWAIGVILFEMLKGSTPWRSRSQQILYTKMLNQPIQTFLFDIPQQCKEFIRRCLKLDIKQRLNIQEFQSWINYFQFYLEQNKVNDQKQNCIKEPVPIKGIVPLRQINLNVNPPKSQRKYQEVHRNQNQSPFKDQYSTNSANKQKIFTPRIQRQTTVNFQNDSSKKPESVIQSYLNFCKFIYKLLRFIETPLKYQFNSAKKIVKFLTENLVKKIQLIWSQFEKNQNILKIEGFEQFLTGHQFSIMKKKVFTYYKKYTLLYPEFESEQIITVDCIKNGIHELLNYLSSSSNYDQKSIIIMDYLTTIYQLYDIQRKYDYNKFGTISRIDLIIQGNPYNIGIDHLNKLINKISIIGI